ncbi:hypothetical protein GGR57DRAFT_244744 [Xylariaceae sp. FL1272]|nr:hypothetical protein GGR57DRAFT_244744 [Xylariaceae sp. FL1272]
MKASRIFAHVAIALVNFTLVLCTSYDYGAFHVLHNSSSISPISDLGSRQSSGPDLRILSLGASIVWGLKSGDNNGFRKALRDQLRFKAWNVNMVGSKRNGNMIDDNVEANPGDIISEVHDASKNSYGYKANIVLINAGTNDCNGNVDIAGAGSRMESLITDLWAADGMQDSLVVLSTILPTTNEAGAKNRISVNQQYRSLIDRLSASGRPIVLADMDYLTLADIGDGIHPTDPGYRKMAYVWWTAIEFAQQAGLIKEAPPIEGTIATNTCDKTFGSGTPPGGLTQRGSGIDDGIYYHDSVSMGVILTLYSDYDRNQWFLARLYGRDRDDIVGWFQQGTDDVVYGVWRNTGNPDAVYVKLANDLSVANNCIPRGVHFVDLNGDGYDDFVCIDPDGNAFASINQRDGTSSKPPTFLSIGRIKDNVGYQQDRVRLGDIDGDGRADYCILDDAGDIYCWRNGGVGDTPEYWQALGKRFTHRGKDTAQGVRFEDINGDGRDDWIWVSDTGEVETWTNSRSCAVGEDGDGLNVVWRQGFHKGETSGNTHYGVGGYADSGLRERIHFGRVYGETQDFGLLGRQDYLFLEHTEQDDGKHRFDVHAWKNIGFGATKLKADGNKYCNMKGYDDGRMDYVWTLSTGKMTLYPNKGLKEIVGQESFWGPSEEIWDPTTQTIGRKLDRRDLHLVDWDGDGACDIVWTDPDNENRVQVWLNRYRTTNDWTWDYRANPAPTLYCPQTRGLGIQDLAVRMADITGNGLADYICMEPDGRSWGFVQGSDNSWEQIPQIKFADGKDRANLRWADVNGDGKDDMIWVNKFTGDGSVWYNGGRGVPSEEGGSSFHWEKVSKPVYDGYQQGTCVYYPDLDGDGRADQHSITHSIDNTATTSFNRCPGLTDQIGDDPGGVVDPGFPPLPINPDDPAGSDGSGGGSGSGLVIIDPSIFGDPNPTVVCQPPCDLLIPPFTLPQTTTISFQPYTTSFEMWWAETTVVTNGAATITSTLKTTTTTTTTTLIIPPLTTNAIEFWQVEVGEDVEDDDSLWVTTRILPPPFVITHTYPPAASITGPPKTRTITPRPYPTSVTHPPGPPPSVTKPETSGPYIPTGITISIGGPPSPTCVVGCGTPCTLFCDHPCLADCTDIGGNDYRDPYDPGPSTSNPEDPDDPVDPPDACEPDVDSSHGLCENGNYPVWDQYTGEVSCEFSDVEAEDEITECQREVDENLDDSLEEIEQAKNCCANRLQSRQFGRMFELRQAPACGPNPRYDLNPPANGQYHSVFTCSFDKWPNVCANARSAILRRGKSPIQTYAAGGQYKHITEPWYNGKAGISSARTIKTPQWGWALKGCEVEEYPFASSNPNRNVDRKILL